METPLTKTEWHGFPAWRLSTPELSVTTVPELGAKIVSLVDRRTGSEWLIGPAAGRKVGRVAYGGIWQEQNMAGWDEMFPTIIACKYPGAGPRHGTELPDHGEAWTLPWQEIEADETGRHGLTLELQGRALRYRLRRTLDLPGSASLRMRYQLDNLEPEPLPYLWAAHPQFLCGAAGQVIFPAQVSEVINTIPAEWGWGPPETRFAWRQALGLDGEPVRLDLTGPPTLKRGRKLFALPEAKPSWAAVLRQASGDWVRFEWDPQELPYLGLWVDEGAVNQQTVAAPEPMTAWYDDLELAFGKGKAQTVAPGGTHTWTLIVRLGIAGNPQPPEIERQR